MGKTFTGVFTFFLLLTSVHKFKQENVVASYSITLFKHKVQTLQKSKLFVQSLLLNKENKNICKLTQKTINTNGVS